MAPSRTETEQAVEERPVVRGKAMDFATSSDVSADDVSAVEAKRDSKTIDSRAFDVKTDPARDSLLTEFGKDTLKDRYLLPGEGPQDLFARVASAYADDQDHAQRVYDYISKLWFMPATPVLSNGGTERGKVDARSLFQKLVETRLATGEPYIIFIDQVNRSMKMM